MDIGTIIRVRLWESLERVVPGHVVQKLYVPVPVGGLKLMDHKDKIFFTNVLLREPRSKQRKRCQKLPRGIQSLLIVLAFWSEKELVGHLGPKPFQRREAVPDIAQGSGEGVGFVGNLAVLGWKHAVVVGKFG